jgi:hypothetical protein
MVDDEAVGVEPEERRSRERQRLPVLDPARPPLDRGSVAADYRLAEATLDVLPTPKFSSR